MVYFDQILHNYYLFILTLFRRWHAKRGRRIVKHHFGRSRYFSENAHNFERHVIHVL